LLHKLKQLLYASLMSPLQRAVDLLKTQAALAAAIGVKQQHIWNWLNRPGHVPPEHCAAIEAASGGQVRRCDLRPDDWHRIWPELIGTEGYPEVSQKAAA
jgi:DNA-binding transcriptional regulator YdaS (Cro superfamily)